jgi:hypothetical protein
MRAWGAFSQKGPETPKIYVFLAFIPVISNSLGRLKALGAYIIGG